MLSMLQDPLSQGDLDATFDIKARTESEIGTEHVDNNQGAISLDDYLHHG